MARITTVAAPAIGIAACFAASPTFAHCYVGARFFPSTLAVHDPCVNDELSFVGGSGLGAAHGHGGGHGHSGGEDHGDGHSHGSETTIQDDVSPPRDYGIMGDWQKRITEDVAFSVETGWKRLHPLGGPTASGWHNLETSLQYQFLTVPEAEFVAKAGLSAEWGKTGNQSVGAHSFTTLTPTVYFGKGFGDLPDQVGFLRPFAVTGQVGYSMPTWRRTVTLQAHAHEHEEAEHDHEADVSADEGNHEDEHAHADPGPELNMLVERHPYALVWGGTIQYSLPYLKANVVDLELPDFINRLTPLVEAKFAQPFTNSQPFFNTQPFSNSFTVSNTSAWERQLIGTVNPGVIWTSQYFQVGAEAIIPINRASGKSVGWMLQLHFYLDDIFPTTIGRPLIQTVLPTTIGRPTQLSFQ